MRYSFSVCSPPLRRRLPMRMMWCGGTPTTSSTLRARRFSAASMRGDRRDHSAPTGTLSRNTRCRPGIRTPSSESSFIPAFGNEWYPQNMYNQGTPEFAHHVATYGPQSKFGYKDFIPMFKAGNFDAKAWADLFRKAGAKYVIPVAEHHDGFAMYDSGLTDWSAAKMGPHRDAVGELAKAVRAVGLHFGVSSHRAEHYFFLNAARAIDSDVRDPKFAAFYGPAHAGVTDKNKAHWAAHPDPAYLDDWLARVAEMVTKYQPEILWFDWWIETKEFEPYRQRLAAFYYNDAARRGSTAAINYKD